MRNNDFLFRAIRLNSSNSYFSVIRFNSCNSYFKLELVADATINANRVGFIVNRWVAVK